MDGRQTTEMRVREAERCFLRHWGWVFPAAGLLLACLTGGGFWAWVDGQTPWLDWRQLFTWRAAVLGGAGAAFWGMWWMLSGVRCRGWIAVVLAALGFAAAECAMRIPAAQTAFWLAVRARTYPDEWILREIVSTQFRKLEGRVADTPGVVICGSSQSVGIGICLARDIDPVPCIRRCSAGLMPLDILQMWEWIPFQRGDICIQFRSEFDFMDQGVFGLSWYRAYDSWRSLPETMEILGWKMCMANWGKLLDHAMAATLEGWRLKDAAGELCKRWWGLEKDGKAIPPVWPKAKHDLVWSGWQLRAFERIAVKLRDMGVELWVFEGDVNPRLHSDGWMERRKESEAWMRKKSAGGMWRWIGEEEHQAGLNTSDWIDDLHLTGEGAEKVSLMMARMLTEAKRIQP